MITCSNTGTGYRKYNDPARPPLGPTTVNVTILNQTNTLKHRATIIDEKRIKWSLVWKVSK